MTTNDPNFWQQRWAEGSIGFHQANGNPHLVAYFKLLGVAEGSRIFIPLCGKTRDIAWLLSQGYQVVGSELVESAIQDLFADLDIVPEISDLGTLKHYRAPNLDIFVGDIFDITSDLFGSADAIFDRAALVALPASVRVDYTRHLTALTNNAPQLLVTYEYDQAIMQGPPFSVDEAEVRRHYADTYEITLLTTVEVMLREIHKSLDKVWLLIPKK